MSRQQYIQQLSNVPIELSELDQWVVHVNKVPHCARTRGKAQANNPATWASFEFACHVFEKGFGDGLSFAFSEHDPYCGVDFDKCVADGKADCHKKTIICGLNSYSELSTSGSGIHVFVKATLESGRKSTKHGIEVYDRSRFFAMTGRRLAVSHKIEERQEKIDELIEKYFPKPVEIQAAPTQALNLSEQQIIEKMTAHNWKARKLWDGDLSAYGGDRSSADFALANHLAFWTGNNLDLMDRLFRQWALFRPQKWERKATQGMTYGQLTLTRAMSRATYKG
jgi:putative DNA primase/helicase